MWKENISSNARTHVAENILSNVTSNINSSPLNVSGQSLSSKGSRRSTVNDNHATKRHKSSLYLTQLNYSALTDITNGGYPQPERHLEMQVQPQIHDDSSHNILLDLTDDSLVENNITYSSDVLIDVVNNSLNLDSVQSIETYTSTDVNDAFICNNKPKRPYKRRANLTNQANGIVIDIDKPKRSYVRKNNVLKELNDINKINRGSFESRLRESPVNVGYFSSS
ncbi:hypothetical protein CASFOL_011666 [Castilleja foliolosa]|uniref:Uncharacterized protein n=1 Tax=Castilleja foliolosa TaxID=1961234 RepID=A0ABD3DXG9_9LAMI